MYNKARKRTFNLKKTDWTMKTQSDIPLFREVKIASTLYNHQLMHDR